MLLDTSGLLCYFDLTDERQARADHFIRTAPARLTHSYVLAEFVTLAAVRGYRREYATRFMRTVLSERGITVVWVDEELHREALDLLDARPDKSIPFVTP